MPEFGEGAQVGNVRPRKATLIIYISTEATMTLKPGVGRY